MQINNHLNLLAEGRGQKSLLAKIEVLEQEQEKVEKARMELDDEIMKSTVRRPTAKQVQAGWSQVVDLWSDLTEDERVEVMESLVLDIQPQTKDRVSLLLSPVAELHGQSLAINTHLGAPTKLSSIAPDRVRVVFEARKGGLLLRSSSDCRNPACALTLAQE